MKPKASIVVRTKNESKWLPHLFGMLKRQKTKDFEVVVIDNQSNDKSAELARRLGATKIGIIEKFKPGLALNMGVELSEGELVVFISAHCIPTHDYWLSELISSINTSDNVFAAYGRQVPLPVTNDLDRRDLLNTFGLDSKIQVQDFFFHNANSIVVKEYCQQFPFDNTASNVEDRIWAKELIDRGHKIAYNPKASVFHYHGLNHKNDFRRMQAVTSLISPLYEHVSPSIDYEITKQHLCFLVIILSNEKNRISSEIFIDIDQAFAKCQVPYNVVVVSNFTNQNLQFKQYTRTSFDFLDQASLFETLKIIADTVEKDNLTLYDHIMFLNPQYTQISHNLLMDLVNKHLREFQDLTFFARRQQLNIWQKTENEILPLASDALVRPTILPLYVAYYGLGTIVSRSSLISFEKIPDYVGIIDLPPDVDVSRVRF